MLKFGEFICKHKKIILVISILLLIPSILGIKATKINYDILVYLPSDIETVQGENILSEDFDMGAFSIVVLENMKSKEIAKLETEVKKIQGVENVVSIVDATGTSIPVESLPQEVKDKIYKDNTTLMLVTFKDAISSDETTNAVEQLRNMTDERCKVSGMTSALIDTRDLSDKEVAIYVLIAVALCIIILELALDSYLVPIFLLLNKENMFDFTVNIHDFCVNIDGKMILYYKWD